MRDRKRGAFSLRLQLALLLAPLFVAACSEKNGAPRNDGALARLEQFGFVPKGRSSLTLDSRRGSTQIAISEPLLVGMYEVTRAEFSLYREQAAQTLDPLLLERMSHWLNSEGALPVSFVTRAEADEYARWSGTRLLTCSEWLFCAISPRNLAYPWADSWQQGRANTLDLGLDHIAPTPVGTFEGGRTATHLYDMLGNVWEWVAEDPAGDEGARSSATALGGSYLSYKQEIYREGKFWEQSPQPGARLEDVGFRVCASARVWLEAHAAEFDHGDDARVRLQAVGRRWGPGAVNLLDEMAQSAQGAARTALETILSGARG